MILDFNIILKFAELSATLSHVLHGDAKLRSGHANSFHGRYLQYPCDIFGIPHHLMKYSSSKDA